ncbi:MAG: hypothetical protein A2381_19225 [Bdellovibrionales bacterium RIFOXYB1_FULL_37_110]|nr:MAG: hypothetical protein A2181_00200 [Bdellovibrionales bacterium RIFOXYA1_FULL_38_20]OFZ49510.1 MAG: hypothetical protein A2417_04375 [Bdellovibrionales bacterium RIFOXYC1_FULL_37_79]OFZ58664.1 MAG: hypothetical protein A2381_19225 [Bdellovibrionales bacterium RIFOXYB1_FULL_37_110]OFZ63218.1 MAG: hypothetical protein A2577_16860 [Bdellovibrionales bacterium RIFOXYD1_FULL_36_51]
MKKIITRNLDINIHHGKSFFLWGPRKVGKTYWIKNYFFPQLAGQKIQAEYIDFLLTDQLILYTQRPGLLRERYASFNGVIVIDEIQKVPSLLDEVHWMIENTKVIFILTGSSARKLKKGHANMLGGRAWRRVMNPLSLTEISEYDIEGVLSSGLLPSHYLSDNPVEELRSYVADYLKEEIIAEALVTNIPNFSNFLNVVAITNSELLNYTNVASESGVSAKVVRSYFDILEDTHLGFRIPPWTKARERRMILTEKFYLFDVGVANYLAKRIVRQGTPEFGKAFEHLVLMEIKAYQAYKNPELDIYFWRTSSGKEVDLILGNGTVALEIKGKTTVHEKDIKSFIDLSEEIKVKHKIVVSLETHARSLQSGPLKGVKILPLKSFIEQLWSGDLL